MKQYRVPVVKRIYGYVDVFCEADEAWSAGWDVISDDTFVPVQDEFDMEYCGEVEELNTDPNADLWR